MMCYYCVRVITTTVCPRFTVSIIANPQIIIYAVGLLVFRYYRCCVVRAVEIVLVLVVALVGRRRRRRRRRLCCTYSTT